MFTIVINDITNYMGIYFLDSVLIGLVCSTILFFILKFFKDKHGYKGSLERIYDKTIAIFFGIVYGYMVIGITLLCREPIFEKTVSLIPFSAPLGNARLKAYLVENILLFIPYGFIIPILLGVMEKWYRCILLGVISSVCIETAQYITARGKAQVDDVVLNSIGMTIGWCIFTIIARMHRRNKAKKEK